MARPKFLRTIGARQGDRSRVNLIVLALSLPATIAALLVVYFAFFK